MKRDITNKRFSLLLVIKYVGIVGHASSWLCRCDCGKEKIIKETQLVHGRTKSCGCQKNHWAARAHETHKLSRTPTYFTWARIKQRCHDKNNKDYARYGAKGIVVCEKWRNSFENFLQDMGKKPGNNYSIDRFPDMCGNYEPGNCRWATATEQCNNRKNSRFIVVKGEQTTIALAARKYGIERSSLRWKITKQGMTADDAVLALLTRKNKGGN